MSTDGLLLVTPEYNNSLPGVFKNAIDWLSRPDADIARVFGGRRVALMGASPGGFGTVLSQAAWLPGAANARRTTMVRPEDARLTCARCVFDETGNLVDEQLRERLRTFLRGFVEFVRAE